MLGPVILDRDCVGRLLFSHIKCLSMWATEKGQRKSQDSVPAESWLFIEREWVAAPLTQNATAMLPPQLLLAALSLLWFCTTDTPSYLWVLPAWLCSMSQETSLSPSQEMADMESENSFTAFIQQRRVAQISRECARALARPAQAPWPELEAQVPTDCAWALSKHSRASRWQLRMSLAEDDSSGCYWWNSW